MVPYIIINVHPAVKSDLRANTYLTLIPRPAMGILTFTVIPVANYNIKIILFCTARSLHCQIPGQMKQV